MGRDQGISPPWAACSEQAGRACVGWVAKLFKDCVCSLRDEVSFVLGMTSLVFWGVAEIPQIITNLQTKSGHGVSLGLLFTWVVGDIFNLVGCLLQPATLPTQFYTAVLYTTITMVLVLQTLYYDYVLRLWKCRSSERKNPDPEVEEGKNPKHRRTSHPTTPIMLHSTNSRRDSYYTSARSLASSGTPTFGSYLGAAAAARSDPAGRGATLLHDASSDDEGYSSTHHHRSTAAGTRGPTSRSLGYGTFIAISASLQPFQTRASMETHQLTIISKSSLQEISMDSNPCGLWLGWIMAAIYTGGRLPQIFLNVKRGSVEGLNPLMFMLALLANATYVGSILVRSVEWKRIKANAPWLLDAVACVLLDLFILLQFAYYRLIHRGGRTGARIYFGDYEEIKKPSL